MIYALMVAIIIMLVLNSAPQQTLQKTTSDRPMPWEGNPDPDFDKKFTEAVNTLGFMIDALSMQQSIYGHEKVQETLSTEF